MGVKPVEYIIRGADKETGEERVEQVLAFSEVHARAIAAEKRILVSSIETVAEFKRRILEEKRAEVQERLQAQREERVERRAGLRETWRERRLRRDDEKRERVALGRHVQVVQIDGTSGVALVIIIAIGVACGLLVFSCCGGIIASILFAGGISAAAGG